MSLSCQKLLFRYPKSEFRLDLSLSVETPTRLAILGPNSCGKTTLLKLLGGHLSPLSGSIEWAGTKLTHLQPRDRPTSMVFQDYALFPHYTVEQNIQFPLRQRSKFRRLEAERAADGWMERVGLVEYKKHLPSELSPGIKQRVAIARSLALSPRMLLLDEPSAALDVDQKRKLIVLLNQLFAERLVEAIVLVTHELDFAFSVADQVAVMEKGSLVCLDQASALRRRPSSVWLARYLQSLNVLSGELLEDFSFRFEDLTIKLGHTSVEAGLSKGEKVALLLPTTAVLLDRAPSSNGMPIRACVNAHLFQGPYCEVSLSVGSTVIRAFVKEQEDIPDIGDYVAVSFDLSKARLLPNPNS